MPLVLVELLLPAGQLGVDDFGHRALQLLPRGDLEPVEHAQHRSRPEPTVAGAAVAEGFEPPDGVSRLSLSRRVH